jgi:hypothetical protein
MRHVLALVSKLARRDPAAAARYVLRLSVPLPQRCTQVANQTIRVWPRATANGPERLTNPKTLAAHV